MDAVLVNNTAKKQKDIALVVLKSGRLTSEDIRVKLLDGQVIEGVEEESEESLGDELDFLKLNDATKKTTKEVQLDNETLKVLEDDEDEY